jgi:hypothetical protein
MVATSKRLPRPPAEYFFERFPWNHQWILFSAGAVLCALDYLAGPLILFPILFVAPVMLLAWNCGLRRALGLGFVLCLIRFAFQYAWGFPWSVPVALVNAGMRLVVLLLMAFLSAKLSQQTQALRARVKTLEGILPTCSFCKDVRDEAGAWHQIEAYIASRSDARFSHGVCPECAEKHYGEILNKRRKTADVAG